MSINILSNRDDSEEQEYPPVDKAYYVDTIPKVDNSEQWLIDTD